jgi:Stage II sporulation protein E (SpoIIE)
VAPALAGGASANGAASAKDPRRATPARPVIGDDRHASSPIVTTITRIVGVVPTLLWVLIAALAALALGLAVRTRLAALRARRLERQRGELLADVGLLQAALLPAPPDRLGPVGTSVAYRPADGPGAGGDFYDVFALEDGRLGVIVGDVSGHGRPALPHTALVRFTLRAYLEAGLEPRAAVQTAGEVLAHQLGGSFATVVVAVYHPRERTLTYACAGHPPPIVLGATPPDGSSAPAGPPRPLGPSGSPGSSRPLPAVTAGAAPPIGAGMRTGTRQTVVALPGSAQLCFYTDGVTEARVSGGGLFGSDRLADALAELGPQATATELLDRVAAETAARPDDMAACLLSIAGESAAAPAVLVEEAERDRDAATGERTERFLSACGVNDEQVAELVRAAQALAARAGSALVEVRFSSGGSPRVRLQRDNVAPLRRMQRVARQA